MRSMLDFIRQNWPHVALTLMTTGLCAGFKYLSARLRAASAKNEALQRGLVALLRDRIVDKYNHYIEKGVWPIYARESMLEMYAEYKALGGNGAIDSLIADLDELPTRQTSLKGE
jgi:hypothetical protein